MCGRFSQYNLITFLQEYENKFHSPPDRYNISPTQNIFAIKRNDLRMEVTSLQWGFIPSWAKDKQISSKMINARAETLTEKSAFKNSFQTKRCLIPANGFYEWKNEGKQKQPYYIKPIYKNGLFFFAGLWEIWNNKNEEIHTCTIITTEANELLKPIHAKNRMPVILEKELHSFWLDPNTKEKELISFLKPYPSEKMTSYPVSHYINRSSNDSLHCIQEFKKPELQNLFL